MKRMKRMVCAMLITVLAGLALPVTAFAEEYYKTWKAYTEGTGLQGANWRQVTDAMDAVLETAKATYAAGDAKGAYQNVNDAYYGYYETTGFERVAMGYISGARKTEMELQFSACKAVTKKGGTVEQFNEEVDKLKAMLRADAYILDGTSEEEEKAAEDAAQASADAAAQAAMLAAIPDDELETHAATVFRDGYYKTWKAYTEDAALEHMTWNDVTDAMQEVLKNAKALYAEGDAKGAYNGVNDAYYGYYETTGFERVAMGYISGARKTEMELQFSACKAVTKKGGTVEQFNEECDKLAAMLRADAHILDGTTEEERIQKLRAENGIPTDAEAAEAAAAAAAAAAQTAETSGAGAGSTAVTTRGSGRSAGIAAFIACFTIILREGFEAILIVGAIIAYLLKSNQGEEQKKMVRPVYIGSVLGIIMSFVSAWILNQLKLANSASQEIIEGVTALIAVVVLYWVSNWMVSKSESEAWSAYIKSKVGEASENRSSFALAFTAFLAVYREGAEVILFYQPMLAGDNINMVWAGFLVGCVCLVFVYIAIRVMSLRLPLKPFFLGTSVLMFIMSIAFLGSGIKELIEGDVITMSSPAWVAWIPSNSVLEILGIYPCAETVIPQLLLLGITIVVFIKQLQRNKKIREEAMAAKAAEEQGAKA